ncbi:hypothetical protein [Granulosicoccus antarcticus]|uniref:Uncharacterized protein n=1 Tax=Granulosicoccus antarcticus IMCC3135 TaxID=1192854 RepID=A0A2Z2NPU0_9GAMM|nr:hypothetical protein [Granulosicoccus antarcticus]ASJ71678.1 hypothetical protein IMCC3135_07875 [Granulosicoccus antarcticus IMCC3135]
MNLCYEHRLNVQLKGIAHCLKTTLASVAETSWSYTNNRLTAETSESDSNPEQCLTLNLNNDAWLKVAPLAPGGLICEDLLIQSDVKSFSTLQHFVNDSGFTAKAVCLMTSEQFHSRFRPDSQGHSLRSDRSTYRLLIMMPDATERSQDKTFIQKILSLLGTLITEPEQTSIECIHKDTFGATNSRELLTQLRAQNSGFYRLGVTAMTPDRKTMLAALMGNASLALCGNSGSLADAFQFGLPVVMWNRAGTTVVDPINRFSLEWFRHGCRTSKSMIASQQQDYWLRLQTGGRSAIAVSNKSSQLHCTIEKWLIHNNSGPAHSITLQGPQDVRSIMEKSITGSDLVLTSAFTPARNPGGLQQLRISIGRKHRKFIKFRHSPTQFIEDSEVRWLRAFKHTRS